MTSTGHPRILVIGDGGAPTGYARVIRAVFERLTDAYEIVQLATRHDGGAHDSPWELLPAADYGDPYGREGLPALIDRLRPDIVFCLYDVAHQRAYVDRIRAAQHLARIVIYSPVESGPLEPELLPDAVDRYVVFGNFARTLVPGLDPEVIPHGLDTDAFRPLPGGRTAARHRLALADYADDDSFIVLNGNRNLVKKRLDVTIEAFARFARGKPKNVRLWLHTDTDGSGFAVAPLIRRHSLAARLILTTPNGTPPNVPTQQLNDIYNACDVGLNTSVNEAWGLVSFEHAASHRAQIVPGNPCLQDLWGEAALVVAPAVELLNPGILTTSYPVAASAVAAALEQLYADERERHRMADAAFARATRSELSWSVIAAQWRALFAHVLAASPPLRVDRCANQGGPDHL